MPRKRPVARKRRTREHVIADLSANHVKRHALLCGYSVERIVHDYGIDLWISTYDHAGELENGQIRVQVKATDRLKTVSGGRAVAVRVAQADFRHWLLEPMPVVLMVYDAQADVACWLYVQAYFETQGGVDLDRMGVKMTVHIPRENVVDQGAMRRFAEFRDKVLAQVKGVVHHDR